MNMNATMANMMTTNTNTSTTLIPVALDETNWRDFANKGRENYAQQLKRLTRNLIWFSLREYLRSHQEECLRFNYSRENNSDPYPAIILINTHETDPNRHNVDLFNLTVMINTFCFETGAADVELWHFAKSLYDSKIVFKHTNIEQCRFIFFTKEQESLITEQNLRIIIRQETKGNNLNNQPLQKI